MQSLAFPGLKTEPMAEFNVSFLGILTRDLCTVEEIRLTLDHDAFLNHDNNNNIIETSIINSNNISSNCEPLLPKVGMLSENWNKNMIILIKEVCIAKLLQICIYPCCQYIIDCETTSVLFDIAHNLFRQIYFTQGSMK